jgi:hypothetical protein
VWKCTLSGHALTIEVYPLKSAPSDGVLGSRQHLTACAGPGNGVPIIVRSHPFRKWPITMRSNLAGPSASGGDRNNFDGLPKWGVERSAQQGKTRCRHEKIDTRIRRSAPAKLAALQQCG